MNTPTTPVATNKPPAPGLLDSLTSFFSGPKKPTNSVSPPAPTTGGRRKSRRHRKTLRKQRKHKKSRRH